MRCEAPTEDDYAQGLKKRQIVMELDYATYQVRYRSLFDSLLLALLNQSASHR